MPGDCSLGNFFAFFMKNSRFWICIIRKTDYIKQCKLDNNQAGDGRKEKKKMKKFRFEIVDAEGYRSGITLAASDTQDAFKKCHAVLGEDDDIVTFEILD